jgi:hypothetical protein
MRGSRWVGEHPDEAADLALEAKLWSGDKASLLKELGGHMWMPGVKQARAHIKVYIHEWVARGLLPPDTDEAAFFERLFPELLPELN